MTKISLFLIITVAICCSGEPQRFRSQRLNSRFLARQEQENPTTEQSSTAPYPASGYRPGRAFNLPTENDESVTTVQPEDQSNGPYPPSGWKPTGRQLILPVISKPKSSYGPPSQEYGPPPSETYGPPPPQETTTINPDESSGEEQTEEPEFEAVDIPGNQIDDPTTQQGSQPGFYFVQLPDGSIQQIGYRAPGSARLELQPVVQAQSVLIEPALTPKAFSYTSQYQSW